MTRLAIHGGPQAAGTFRTPAWPVITDEDRQAVAEALESCSWCRLAPESCAGKLESAFASYHDAQHAIAVSNGTVAIELALLAAGIRPGDEVLVPALTFIATAGAVVRVGAIPVFVDSDPETAAISADAIKQAITWRTRAVVAVHYGGYTIDFDAVLPVIKQHGLALIEDCAHAQGTEWRGRKVGAIGQLGTFSFQQTKALSAGEGGIVVTNDERLAEAATLYHNIGRVPGKAGYEHFVLASNYRLPELSAALLLAQLSRLQAQVEQRMQGYSYLVEGLDAVGGLRPLRADPRITQRGFYFMVLRYDRDQFAGVPLPRFLQALQAEGVPCSSGYGIPLYRQAAFRREHVAELLGRRLQDVPDYPSLHLPVAERFCAEEQVTLPHSVLMADPSELDKIVEAAAKIKAHASELAVI